MLHELGTHRYILGTLNGTLKTYPNLAFDVVGIKDVAMAHTLAYESGHAMGQCNCSGRVLHFADLILHLIYDISVRDPHKTVSRVPPYNLSSQKLRDFGLHFQPVEDVIYESVIEIEGVGTVGLTTLPTYRMHMGLSCCCGADWPILN